MIDVICYNQVEHWHSRNKAIEFYKKGMRECDGSEAERYTRIYLDLIDGKAVAHDGDSRYTSPDLLVCMGREYKTTAPDGSRDYDGKIWYAKV